MYKLYEEHVGVSSNCQQFQIGEFDNREDLEAFMLMYATMSGEPMTYEG